VFLSPWLSGIPVSGDWTTSYLPELAQVLSSQLAEMHLQSALGRDLGPLELALAAEYAAWKNGPDALPERAPLVRRLVAAHGEEALPGIFRSLEQVQTLHLLLAQWLGLSADSDPEAYFGALLDIEREAVIGARLETFLLVQDGSVPGWAFAQQGRYLLAQSTDLQLPPPQVLRVSQSGDLARVTLQVAEGPYATHPFVPEDSTVLFRRIDGEWLHTPGAQGEANGWRPPVTRGWPPILPVLRDTT
jgi:hypothetical protein